jgi:hypothetical protein
MALPNPFRSGKFSVKRLKDLRSASRRRSEKIVKNVILLKNPSI